MPTPMPETLVSAIPSATTPASGAPQSNGSRPDAPRHDALRQDVPRLSTPQPDASRPDAVRTGTPQPDAPRSDASQVDATDPTHPRPMHLKSSFRPDTRRAPAPWSDTLRIGTHETERPVKPPGPQPSATSHPPLATGLRPPATGHRPPALSYARGPDLPSDVSDQNPPRQKAAQATHPAPCSGGPAHTALDPEALVVHHRATIR